MMMQLKFGLHSGRLKHSYIAPIYTHRDGTTTAITKQLVLLDDTVANGGSISQRLKLRHQPRQRAVETLNKALEEVSTAQACDPKQTYS